MNITRKIKKIGLFGGTFNPVHLGHKNSVEHVLKTLSLDKIIVMPVFQNPQRTFEDESTTPEQRFTMVNLTFKNSKCVEVNDFEIKKGGLSFTVDTLSELMNSNPNEEYFLIMGPDQFANFHTWKDYKTIMKNTNLVVTTRPGYDLNIEEIEALHGVEVVKKSSSTQLSEWRIDGDKTISFVQLEDMDISSSEIRQRLRLGESVSEMLSENVIQYIEQEKIYPHFKDYLQDIEGFVLRCAKILDDNKALNIIAKDMREEERPMEFALIASGTSKKHATSIAEKVVREIRKEFKLHPIHLEGHGEGQWVVIDYGPVMIHVFYDFTRQEYKLEHLWRNTKDLELSFK
jgi:nicotinate-nucleotide adenylyltransferase